MNDIGGRLCSARQRIDMTVEELSARTKISVALLEAVERNDFGRIPAGVVGRGYLRSYAREVGLDGRVIVEEYRTAFESQANPSDFVLSSVRSEQASLAEWRRKWVLALALVAAAWLFMSLALPSRAAHPPGRVLSADSSGRISGPPPRADGPRETSGRGSAY